LDTKETEEKYVVKKDDKDKDDKDKESFVRIKYLEQDEVGVSQVSRLVLGNAEVKSTPNMESMFPFDIATIKLEFDF